MKLLFPDLDSEQLREIYFKAYRKVRPLDETHLAYYGTVKSLLSLTEGTRGHVIWGHPEITRLLLAFIHETTGITIEMPSMKPSLLQ